VFVRSLLVERLLQRSGLVYTHLHASTPLTLKHNTTDPWWSKPRGVLQRNAGLQWVRNHLSSHYQRSGNGSIGVIYFADDDNTYDLRLFEEVGLCVETVETVEW
jgi:Glycosyltransferase family 43